MDSSPDDQDDFSSSDSDRDPEFTPKSRRVLSNKDIENSYRVLV